MALHQASVEGDTRVCPKCLGTLMFTRHHVILTADVVSRGGPGVRKDAGRDRLTYQVAWICQNPRCDYRRVLQEH